MFRFGNCKCVYIAVVLLLPLTSVLSSDVRIWQRTNALATPSVWKDYLERLPAVELISFSGAWDSYLHYGSWQDNGFFVRDITNFNQIGQPITRKSLPTGFGRLENDLWDAAASQISRTPEPHIPVHLLYARSNAPWSTFQLAILANEQKLLETLCFGLRGLDTTTLVWSDNQFRAIMDGYPIVSKWSLDEEFRISSFVIDWNGEPEKIRIEYRYDEAINRPVFFPSEIAKFTKQNGEYRLVNRIKIFSLQLAESRLPDERFLPMFQMDTNIDASRILSSILIEGEWVPHIQQEKTQGPGAKVRIKTVLLIFLLLSVAAFIAIFVVVRKAAQKQNTA